MALVNVDVDLLRTLVAISETRSFTRAGERLLRTQSAISLQVKRLEQMVGQNLLERGKDVKLTPAGEMVRAYALEILKLNDALVREVAGAEDSVAVSIGTPDDYAQLILPGIIREFSRSNSDVEFRIVSDLSTRLSNLVDAGELDLAFITRAADIDGIDIVREPLTWIGNGTGAAARQNPIPLALFPKGCRIRDLAVQSLESVGRRWRIAYSSNQFAPLRTAIAAGDAIGVIPVRAVPADFTALGADHGLPPLPYAEIVIKVGAQAPDIAHRLAATIAQAFRPGAAGTA